MTRPAERDLRQRAADTSSPPGRDAAPQSAPLAQLRGVGKRFGATTALTDVDLTITVGTSHALVGRNGAGKSTLVAILTGVLQPDTGQVLINGEPTLPAEQRTASIACVYQRPTVLPALTVTENLLLGGPSLHGSLIRWRMLHRQAAEILDQWGIPVRSTTLARDLSVEQRQLVEIARALSRGSKLVILDEPTAQLDRRASSRLFGQMRALQAAGITFLFISHQLHEVYDVCQDVTVLRDGRRVASARVEDLPLPRLVQAMVGDSPPAGSTGSEGPPGPLAARTMPPSPLLAPAERGAGAVTAEPEILLRVEQLCLPGCFTDVSLTVKASEIVAVAGLTSSGKTELAETIAGLRRATSGQVLLSDVRLPPGRIDAAIAQGVGYVPEDRHASGFAPQLSIVENLTSSVSAQLARWGWLRRTAATELAGRLADRLQIIPADLRAPLSSLSGGNQQKVVMGRALASSPRLLVLINPTAGVDIASKQALYAVIDGARAGATAVLLVTDDSDELAVADRTVVMHHGQVTAEFTRPWRPEHLIAAIEGATIDSAAAGQLRVAGLPRRAPAAGETP